MHYHESHIYYHDMTDDTFTGRQVLVTGASRGIGLGVARAFLAAGAEVTVTGTRPEATAYDDDLSGFRYRRCRMDKPDDIAALAAEFSTLDVLVNNAGQSRPDGASEWDPAVFDRVVGVDLLSVFRLSSACQPALCASAMAGGASVVNVVSLSCFFGVEAVIAYGAAKGGLNQLTKGLAVSWAAHGIRVNAVAPGLIATDLAKGMTADAARAEAYLTKIPQRRFGTPEDVAPAVLFLASPAASFVTGATLVIDGGQLAAG
jgi:3-oxoacyl-[acyl-carrier protein] reductase